MLVGELAGSRRECVVWKLSNADVEVGEVAPLLGADARRSAASGVMPSCRALSMIGVPCASLAQT